jgi:hypothetical protein
MCALLLSAVLGVNADTPFFPEGAKLEKVWGEGEFTEGPAYGPDHCVYFSDIGNRILTAHEDRTGQAPGVGEPRLTYNGARDRTTARNPEPHRPPPPFFIL